MRIQQDFTIDIGMSVNSSKIVVFFNITKVK